MESDKPNYEIGDLIHHNIWSQVAYLVIHVPTYSGDKYKLLNLHSEQLMESSTYTVNTYYVKAA